MNRSLKNRRWVIAAGLAAAALLVPAVWAGSHTLPTPKPAPKPTPKPVLAVVVTDQDPQAVQKSRAPIPLNGLSVGPFNAQRTLTLHVLALFDRRLVGTQPFDQITTFTLPDGSVFERRVTPVNPQGLPSDTVQRSDLGPAPVPAGPPTRMKSVARTLPVGRIDPILMRDTTYTDVKLPVSGTWITTHNLYGEWKVDVTMVRAGKTLSTADTTFRLGLD